MPQNEDYETDGNKKMCSMHKRIEYVVRCMYAIAYFSSQSENEQIIVMTKALYIFMKYNSVPAKI